MNQSLKGAQIVMKLLTIRSLVLILGVVVLVTLIQTIEV